MMNLIKSEKELYGSFKVDIKSVMKMENISRTKLSKVTGIKYDIINKYYNDRCKQVDLGTLAKICCVLKCNVQDIIIYDAKLVSESDEI